jgi:hypothetical protein
VITTYYPHTGIMKVKHPQIIVPLVGEDGNAFAILARVMRVMKRNGIYDQWDEFHTEATSGDYDHLLRTVVQWFRTEGEDW